MTLLSEISAAIDWSSVKIAAVLDLIGFSILIWIPILARRHRKAGGK